MSILTESQKMRVQSMSDEILNVWPSKTAYIDADDLSDIVLDGHFHLRDLRSLVQLLSACEEEHRSANPLPLP
jgi:hypothetical protein